MTDSFLYAGQGELWEAELVAGMCDIHPCRSMGNEWAEDLIRPLARQA